MVLLAPTSVSSENPEKRNAVLRLLSNDGLMASAPPGSWVPLVANDSRSGKGSVMSSIHQVAGRIQEWTCCQLNIFLHASQNIVAEESPTEFGSQIYVLVSDRELCALGEKIGISGFNTLF